MRHPDPVLHRYRKEWAKVIWLLETHRWDSLSRLQWVSTVDWIVLPNIVLLKPMICSPWMFSAWPWETSPGQSRTFQMIRSRLILSGCVSFVDSSCTLVDVCLCSGLSATLVFIAFLCLILASAFFKYATTNDEQLLRERSTSSFVSEQCFDALLSSSMGSWNKTIHCVKKKECGSDAFSSDSDE